MSWVICTELCCVVFQFIKRFDLKICSLYNTEPFWGWVQILERNYVSLYIIQCMEMNTNNFLTQSISFDWRVTFKIFFDNLSTIRWCSLLAQTTSKPSLRPTHARFSTQTQSSTPPLFSLQHPIVILKDVAFEDLQTVVKFMYHGIVNVSSDKLPAVLKVIYRERFFLQRSFPQTADALQIKGLEKNNELMAPYLTGRLLNSHFCHSGE